MRRPLLILISSSAFVFSACNCGKAPGLLETNGILTVTPETIEFGAVPEFTQKKLPLSLENTGRGALTLAVAVEDGTSADFTMGPSPVELAPGARVDLELTFTPLGAGEDTGAIVITSDQPDRGPQRVPLHGGAIFPSLAFDPDPLAFAPVAAPLVSKLATLRNVGDATLHVSAVGVSPQGSPDFSITPPMLPLSLVPDASVQVTVAYARSLNAAEGLLQVVSDERIDGGVRSLRLLPDPSRVCGDGIDNDNDGLTDFPDDIGCTSTEDDDEFNLPECVTGGQQPCGSTTGACRAGVRVCANSIWGACDGGVRPGVETCNGVDDDCNGMSDENLSELCTINGCAGARACVPNSGADGGLFTSCIPISSMPEACNGLDDNCNGQVDEGVVQTCTVFGCLGVKVCVPGTDGGFTSCMATNPLPETCNGLDDNCNGQVDELPDLVCGIGPCRRTAPACVNGAVGTCVSGTPGVESCNGVDDDCNGTVDDGVAPLTCGVGACANSVAACTSGGGTNVCMPLTASAEICNNVDDNCNGVRDEQLDGGPITRACYTGMPASTRNIGRCREGTESCASGSFGSCLGEVLPTAETCNNVDDNCNGSVDDGIGNVTCGVGACFRSVASCISGMTQTCTAGTPTAETCNNVDDNCNSRVDDSADGGVITQPCYSGPAVTRGVGRCRDGTQSCSAGGFGSNCNGEVLPAASETCGNNIDDNCAGGVDEGCTGCNPNGTFTLDAGTIAYTCCFGMVSANISAFTLSTNGATIDSSPSNPGTMIGAATTCPSGSFTNTVSISGGCTETYRITGSFVGQNTFVGTYSMSFSGPDCSCFGGLGTPCTNQTWNISAGR